MATTVTFDSGVEEVHATARAVTPRDAWREWIPPVAIAAFCLFAAWQAVLADSGAEVVIGFLVAAPASGLLVRRVRAAAARRAYERAGAAAGVLGRRTVTLGDEGVVATTAHGQNLLRWEAVKVRRTDRHVLVLAGPGMALAIPVRAFGGPDRVDAFVAEVARRGAGSRLPAPAR